MRLRTDSASSRSCSAVEPIRSAKTTVTILRATTPARATSRPTFGTGSGAATREAPQAPQNRWSGGFTWVQAGQARASEPPQAPQKRLAAGFALPHDGQVTPLGLRRASLANDKRLPANGSSASARASRSVLIPRTTPNHTWRLASAQRMNGKKKTRMAGGPARGGAATARHRAASRRTSPTNAAVHAASANQKNARGITSSQGRSIAWERRTVLSVYIPSGK